jgi:thiosulfate dehydrogenase
MKRFIIGVLLGLLVLPGIVLLYFKVGTPPVAVGDPSLPFEKQIVSVPLHARIEREMPKGAPIPAEEATFKAGAGVYQAQCAVCHGSPGRSSPLAGSMFPPPPQLFERHGSHVGVSNDAPGETYWKVANGIRLSGMPSYAKLLNEPEMWQVSLLLANADKLPGSVQEQLNSLPPQPSR